MTLGKLLPPPQPPGLGFPICAVVEVVHSDLSKSDHPPLNPLLRLPLPPCGHQRAQQTSIWPS